MRINRQIECFGTDWNYRYNQSKDIEKCKKIIARKPGLPAWDGHVTILVEPENLNLLMSTGLFAILFSACEYYFHLQSLRRIL